MIVFYLISLTLCVYYTYSLIAASVILLTSREENYVPGYILGIAINNFKSLN